MHIEYFRKYLNINQHNIESFLFFSIMLFLPTQFGKHFWPSYSLVLGQRIDYLSPTLYVTDMLIMLLFTAWLTQKIIHVIPIVVEATGNRTSTLGGSHTTGFIERVVLILKLVAKRFLSAGWRIPLNDKKVVSFCFIIIFLILNTLLSQSLQEALYGLLKLFELGFLTYYTCNILRTNLKIILFPFMFGIILESILAIAQFFVQSSLGGMLYYFGERTFTSVTPGIANASINGQLLLRPYGTFSHPNVLAGYLVISMTIILMCHSGLPCLPAGRSRMTTIFFYLFTLLLGTVGLCLTLSRVAILVWLLVCAFLLIRFFQKKLFTRKILLIANGLLAIVVVTLFIISPLLPRFSQLTLQDESVVLREQLALDAYSMLFAHPVFGVGLHNFLSALPHYDFSRGSVFSIQPVHNIFLLIGAETGFVGMWVSVSFVIWLYIRLFKTFRPPIETGLTLPAGRQEPVSINKQIFIILLLTEIIILGSFDHYFLTIQQGQLLLGLVLGYILGYL